jgi:hypothetical protein
MTLLEDYVFFMSRTMRKNCQPAHQQKGPQSRFAAALYPDGFDTVFNPSEKRPGTERRFCG